MGWKNRISRFNGKMTKEKWLLLLLIGVLLMILSFPLPGGSKKDKNAGGQIAGAGTEGAGAVPLWTKDNTNGSGEDSGFGKDNRELFPVVTIIIMAAFIRKMRRLKGVRKQLIVEEAWKALSSANMADYLRYIKDSQLAFIPSGSP